MNAHLLVVSCDGGYYAIPVASVVRVIRVVEVTPLPESPAVVSGVFDLQGELVPVVSMRRLLSLSDKEIALEDVLVVLYLHGRQIALMADGVEGVFASPRERTADPEVLFPELSVTEVVRWNGNLLPVVDVALLIGHEIHDHLAAAESRGLLHEPA